MFCGNRPDRAFSLNSQIFYRQAVQGLEASPPPWHNGGFTLPRQLGQGDWWKILESSFYLKLLNIRFSLLPFYLHNNPVRPVRGEPFRVWTLTSTPHHPSWLRQSLTGEVPEIYAMRWRPLEWFPISQWERCFGKQKKRENVMFSHSFWPSWSCCLNGTRQRTKLYGTKAASRSIIPIRSSTLEIQLAEKGIDINHCLVILMTHPGTNTYFTHANRYTFTYSYILSVLPTLTALESSSISTDLLLDSGTGRKTLLNSHSRRGCGGRGQIKQLPSFLSHPVDSFFSGLWPVSWETRLYTACKILPWIGPIAALWGIPWNLCAWEIHWKDQREVCLGWATDGGEQNHTCILTCDLLNSLELSTSRKSKERWTRRCMAKKGGGFQSLPVKAVENWQWRTGLQPNIRLVHMCNSRWWVAYMNGPSHT